MAGESRSVARVVAALVVTTWLVGFAPVLLGGRTFAAEPHLGSTLPWFERLAGAIAGGSVPEWDDASGLGASAALEGGRPLCYPPAWLVGALPRPWGTDALALAHLLLFGLGAAAWARRLGADPLGAVVAGGGACLSVAATGALTAGAAVCAAAWLPWVGWAADRLAALVRGEPIRALVARALALAVVLAALLLAAGGATGAALAAPAVAAAAIAVRGPGRAGAWLGLLGAMAAALLLSAAAWIPAALTGALRLPPADGAGLDFEPAEILAMILAAASCLAGAAAARRGAAAAVGLAALAALAPVSGDGFPAGLAALVYPLAGLGASATARALARVERLHRIGPAVAALIATAAIGPLAARTWGLPFEDRDLVAEPPALLAGAVEDAADAGTPIHLTPDTAGRPKGGPSSPKGREAIDSVGAVDGQEGASRGAARSAGGVSEAGIAGPAVPRDPPPAAASAAPSSSREASAPRGAGHAAPFSARQPGPPAVAAAPSSSAGPPPPPSAGHAAPFSSSRRANPSVAAPPPPAAGPEALGAGHVAPPSSGQQETVAPTASDAGSTIGRSDGSAVRVPIATSSSSGGQAPLATESSAVQRRPGVAVGATPRRRIAWPDHAERGYRDAPPETGARFGFAYVPGRDRGRDPELATLWRASSGAGRRLLDLFGVAYAVVPATVAVPAAMPIVGTSSSGERVLVETRARRARAFVAPRWSWHADAEALRLELFPVAPDQRDALSFGQVRLSGAGAPPPRPGRGPLPPGPCAIESPRPERVRLVCRSSGAGYAVLLDRAAPGWSARVDGQHAAIVTADLLVRAVAVPPGLHRIDFVYRTPGLRLGGLLSGAAWLNALALALLLRRLRRADQPRTSAVPIEPG